MKNKKLWISIFAAFLAVLMVASLAVGMIPMKSEAASSSALKAELNKLKNEKKELQNQIKDLDKDIDANLSEIKQEVAKKNIIDQEIGNLSEQIANINEQLTTYALLIADKQEELDTAQLRLEELNEQNKIRIRAMEEHGTPTYWSVLFQATSISDLLDRWQMINEIKKADERCMREMKQAAKEVEQAKNELTAEKEEMELTRQELGESQVQLELKREESDKILEALNARGDEFDRLMDEAEDAEQELLKEIAKAEKEYNEAKKREDAATATTKKPNTGGSNGGNALDSTVTGGIKWLKPCKYTKVSSSFGWRIHPVYKTKKFHQGIDLSAANWTPIYATRSGTVTVSKYSSTAGYYVTINHGDGFSSVYMHMIQSPSVKAGAKVSAGQLIGYVGSTGTSTGPHLHFGIAKNGEYVNPAKYIDF